MLTKLCTTRHQTRCLGCYTAIILEKLLWNSRWIVLVPNIIGEQDRTNKSCFETFEIPALLTWLADGETLLKYLLLCLSTSVNVLSEIQSNTPQEIECLSHSPTTSGGSTWRCRVTLISPISFLAVHLYWPPSSGLASSTTSMCATECSLGP